MSNITAGRKRGDTEVDAGPQVEEATGILPRVFKARDTAADDTAAKTETDRQVSERAGAISAAVRSSGQASGTAEVGQPTAAAPAPDAPTSQGGDTGQNIAPTKKRGAYRAPVGGANSIRI